MRIILHIDVNNAFLSWTAIHLLNNGYKTDIRNVCAVIGGDESKRHGIVLAKSILAKKMGINTAETLYSARKKYPKLQIFPPKYDFYEEMSNKLFDMLKNYSPDIEIFSIDECYFDYGKVKNIYGDELAFANKLKSDIKQKLGFTVNIGIANNKLCAKMASDLLKPDLVHTMYESEVQTKMWPLPINDLFGIGRKTASKLIALDIKTIGDLASASYDMLYPLFKNQTKKMIDLAWGLDDSLVISNDIEQKGISNSTTLIHDVNNKEEIFKTLYLLSDNLGISLRKQNRYGYVISVTLKDRFFSSYSHQVKLDNPTNSTDEIFEVSKKLFIQMWKLEPIRLVGIRVDRLVKDSPMQMSLFEDINVVKSNQKLEHTIDNLRERYGHDVITKCYLKGDNKKAKK